MTDGVTAREAIGAASGAVTRDGCPVDVYARLPSRGEPELISSWIPPRSSILDLGAGAGRLADPLVLLGHFVVAVDESAEMLARVRRARPILSEIGSLHLTERFDAVVLASHLVNVPDADVRLGLLATVARHLSNGGRAFLQWHAPQWFDEVMAARHSAGKLGDVGVEFQAHDLVNGVLAASVVYRVDDRSWRQDFHARRLQLAELDAEARLIGLANVRRIPGSADWLAADPAGAY